jgi:hypothetical protein
MVLFHEASGEVESTIPARREKERSKRRKIRRLDQVIESVSGPSLLDDSLYLSTPKSKLTSERNIKKRLSPIGKRSDLPLLSKITSGPTAHKRLRFQDNLVVGLVSPCNNALATPMSSTKSRSDSIDGSLSTGISLHLLSPDGSESYVSSGRSTPQPSEQPRKKATSQGSKAQNLISRKLKIDPESAKSHTRSRKAHSADSRRLGLNADALGVVAEEVWL